MTDIQTWLDHGRALADQATEGPWFTSPFEHDPVWGSVVTGGVDEHEEDRSPCIEAGNREDATFIADARTRLPQALNALQAVLDMHVAPEWVKVGRPNDGSRDICQECTTEDTLIMYPCRTVRAIQDAIGDNDD